MPDDLQSDRLFHLPAGKHNIALTGYRATGKSSVAKRLAERLGWRSVDADQEIHRRAGRTIREIFASQGEQAFRDLESDVVADLAGQAETVISLGGGAIVREANRRRLRGSLVIWLQAAPQEIWRRLQQDPDSQQQRPPLTSLSGYDELEKLLAQRQPLYEQVSDLTVITDNLSIDQVVQQVMSLFPDST
jgi:shikimate kinase